MVKGRRVYGAGVPESVSEGLSPHAPEEKIKKGDAGVSASFFTKSGGYGLWIWSVWKRSRFDGMKGFERENQLLSLCGLNCGLCPMLLSGYCGGCGNGNQPCAIARCSLEHGKIEYCCACGQYPCEKYDGCQEFDSFITHRRQMADLERAGEIGIDAYNQEQMEKRKILDHLLADYNDGRRKAFFCTAVNLLELPELREAMEQLRAAGELPVREKGKYAADVIQKIAGRRNAELKLRKKNGRIPHDSGNL